MSWASSTLRFSTRRYITSAEPLSTLRTASHTGRRTKFTRSAASPALQLDHDIDPSEEARMTSTPVADSVLSIDKSVPALSYVSRRHRFKVSTLDHTRLTSDDFLDLSNRRRVRARAYVSSTFGASHTIHDLSLLAIPAAMHTDRFPQHARGFLYYHLAPNAPPLSGQVRFRVTGANDPTLFSAGQDLCRPDGLPWRIPFIAIANLTTYGAYRRRLLDDRLVSEQLLRLASSLPEDVKSLDCGSSRIVHALDQPFFLGFGQRNQRIYFIGTDTARIDSMSTLATYGTHGCSAAPVLSGSALCRFEKSTLPEHAGRRVVVCRALRFLEPVVRTGARHVPDALMPREGELLRKSYMFGLESPAKAFDLDGPVAKGWSRAVRLAEGLALLYDNEVRAGGPVGW